MITGVVFVLVAALCGALSHVCAKRALTPGQSFSLFLVTRASAGVAFSGLVAAVYLAGGARGSASLWVPVAAAASGMLVPILPNLFYFSALRRGRLSVVSPVAHTSPLFACMLAVVFLGETMGPWRWASVLLVLTGGALVSARSRVRSQASDTTGSYEDHVAAVLFALATALVIAVSMVVNKWLLRSIGAQVLVFLQNAAALILFGILRGGRCWQQRHGGARTISRRAVAWTLASGVLAFGLTNFLVLLALQRMDASLVAPLTTTSIVFAMVLAALFLGERPSRWQCLGGALITGGCALLALA